MDTTSSQNDKQEAHLNELKPGEKGRVLRLEVEGAQRRRLLDLGLIPGTLVEAVLESPLRDPVAYRIRQTLIALRHDQAGLIIVARDVQENTKTTKETT